ncbi:MAG TPA: methylmalonyl-CoA mutase family protein [Methyloceanibacter sp.]|nr:methylmalonyl-CoA mutase family protein [Methyloceanibacter sp.]
MAEISLAKGFAPAGEAAWRALVEEALKGMPFAALKAKTYDGIAIEPLYARAREARPIAGRAPGLPWSVMQRIDHPDAKAANAQILDDVNNGANGIALVFEGAVGDHGYALAANGTAISAALDDVYLDAGIALDLDLGLQSKDAAGLLATLVKARAIAPKTATIRFGFNPLGAIALAGASPLPWKDIAALLAALVADLAGQGFAGPFAAADGRVIHAAGGSGAQELAFALASAVAYLRALEQGGIALEDARGLIYFRLAADQDQFFTIAKFRAIRKLWARVEEACGLQPRPAFVSAETAWRMMTKRDPHGNIVRGTIAALGAAAGGADAVAILPFSAALGLPDAFARRIARNTQTILIEEANIHRVADPAAGSGAIEALTDALAEAAWGLFQEIEREGGTAQALETGSIQQAVAKVRTAREANIARRTVSLVGTSDFPDLDETEAAVLALPRLAALPANAKALSPMRQAEPFERLRDKSDLYRKKHGARPKVFLASLGRPADFNARSSFAKSLFEAGGIEAVEGDAGNLAKRFKESGAKLACLCSSDKVYEREAEAAAKALREAGAKRIYLAGRPDPDQTAFEQAGIGSFLHQGCDTLAILNTAYDEI